MPAAATPSGVGPAPGLLLRQTLVAFGASLALTFAAFSPGLDAAFVSDDVNAIVENEWVRGPVDPVGIATNFSWWGAGRLDAMGFRPAATLTFAWNHAASGLSPRSFRVVNFALHALVAALVFAWARQLGVGAAAAGAGAALFAVLPVHSEAVVWIVGRAELGAAAAFVAAGMAALAHRRRPSAAALAAAAVATALGMAFKENTVTVLAVPLVLALATESSPLLRRRDALATAAMAAGAAACMALRALADGPGVGPAPESLLDNPLTVVDLPTRLFGAVAVLGRYARLTAWPSSLSVDYSFDALGIGPGFVASADTAAAAAFVALLAWGFARGGAAVRIGILAAAASYSIVSNTVFVIGTILGERLFYLPTVGLVLAAAAAADPLVDACRRSPRLRAGAVAALAVAIASSLAVDRRRAAEWQTPATLFRAATESVPRSARARMEYASALGSEGRIDEASVQFAEALAILPGYAAAAYNRGNMFAKAGRFDEAASSYRQAVEANPRFARAWHNLALTERIRGRTEAWIEALGRAVEVAAAPAAFEGELLEALLATGRNGAAVEACDRIRASGVAAAATWFHCGVARHRLGACPAALDDYRRAAASPGAPREALAAAAGCLREAGRDAEARAMEEGAKVANRDTRR